MAGGINKYFCKFHEYGSTLIMIKVKKNLVYII